MVSFPHEGIGFCTQRIKSNSFSFFQGARCIIGLVGASENEQLTLVQSVPNDPRSTVILLG